MGTFILFIGFIVAGFFVEGFYGALGGVLGFLLVMRIYNTLIAMELDRIQRGRK